MLETKHNTSELKSACDYLDEHMNRLWKGWQAESCDLIYHYTRVDGIKGILESQTLRSFDVLSMDKDPEEVRFAAGVVARVMCSQRRKLPWTVTQLFRSGGLIGLTSGRWNAYVVSLTSTLDAEYHWRCFAEHGQGAAIEFRANTFAQHGEIDNRFALFPIQYDQPTLISAVESACDRFLGYPGTARMNYYELKWFAFHLCQVVINTLLRFKKQGFHIESEWRAITLLPSVGHGRAVDPISGRKYVKLPVSAEVVTRIILGPHCQITESKMRELLNAYGFSNVEVDCSTRTPGGGK